MTPTREDVAAVDPIDVDSGTTLRAEYEDRSAGRYLAALVGGGSLVIGATFIVASIGARPDLGTPGATSMDSSEQADEFFRTGLATLGVGLAASVLINALIGTDRVEIRAEH